MNTNASSSKRSASEKTLELDEATVRRRLGEKRCRLLKLWIDDVNGAFDGALAAAIDDAAVVLDAGCSRGDPDLPALTRARLWVGCDADHAGLVANRLADERVETTLERLPFAAESVDVVACKFVVEHLETPAQVFSEFARVLRPGGRAAILTPNRLSPFALCASVLPFGVKQRIKSRLFGGHDEDTFPTAYRANTPGRLDSLMAGAGLRRERLELLPGMWAYFIFSELLAKTVRAAERAQMRVPGLRNAATQILGVWRKPGREE